MHPTRAGGLLLMAFDHRDHFGRLVERQGDRGLSEHAAIVLAKELALDAALAVRRELPEPAQQGLGVFVDEQYGAATALRARAEGLLLAMPAERSGAAEFVPEFADRYREHIEAFAPDIVKVLVRWNPEADRSANERQGVRLAELSHWCAGRTPDLLFELLVPPTPDQCGDAFAAEQRLGLTLRAVQEAAAAGIRPAIWKIEAPADPRDLGVLRDACLEVTPAARVVVLGGGAAIEDVTATLAAAAAAGLDGFAVGRTIWDQPIAGWLAGEVTDAAAVEQMADAYRRCLDAFRAGAAEREPADVLR